MPLPEKLSKSEMAYHVAFMKGDNMADYEKATWDAEANLTEKADTRGMKDPGPTAPTEHSLEDEIQLLENHTRILNDLMVDINKTRNRIYEKRMRLNEQEEKLGSYIHHILHGDNEGVDVNESRPRY